ncbi:ATP synthase subunit I [Bacillus sp. 1P06AnD]|uniref:ATP synthase subunit I n=1 Tax=Bacillus sp. 1P06AnD TaxID=3132208 RepID=UPI0039A39D3F
MPDIQYMFKRQLKYILYLLALYVLGWGFTKYQAVFAGLILGTSVGLFNLWLLARRSIKIGEVAVAGKKARSVGSASRYASAILATIIAMRYPEHFSIISTVLGLVTATVVMIIIFIIHESKVNYGEER